MTTERATLKETLAERFASDHWVDRSGREHTYADMEQAFGEVANPDDWKAPIDCCVAWERVPLVVAAIEFYTATVPTVDALISNMTCRLRADGYRAGPAGDH